MKIFKKLPKLDFDTPIISFKRKKKLKSKQFTTPLSKDDQIFDFSSIPSIQKLSSLTFNDENSLSNYSADIKTPIIDPPEVFNIENSNSHLHKAGTITSSLDEFLTTCEIELENIEIKLYKRGSDSTLNSREMQMIAENLENK